MTDPTGVKTAAARGIKLGEVGHRVVLENEHVRIWEVLLEPGQTIDFHIHHPPYIVISRGGGENEVETIFGDKIPLNEPLGATVFIDQMRPVQKLTKRAKIPYVSRLVEHKQITLPTDETSFRNG